MNAARRQEEGGFGLVELLVAMALTSVLLAVLAGVFLSDLRTTSRISAKVDATADARLVVDTIARRVRVAAPPDTITAAFIAPLAADRSTLYASIAGGALGGAAPGEQDVNYTKVDYRIVSVTRDGRATQCVQETLTPGTSSNGVGTYPSAGARTRGLAYGVINSDGRPLFTYLASGTGEDVAASAADVRSVRIAVSVTSTRGDQRATTAATTRVSLPNVCTVGESSC